MQDTRQLRGGASRGANATSDSEEHVGSGAVQPSRGRGSNEASEVGSPHGASGRAIIMPTGNRLGERVRHEQASDRDCRGAGKEKGFYNPLRCGVGTEDGGQTHDSFIRARNLF